MDKNYTPYVTTIEQMLPHPNADKLAIAVIDGIYNVVTSKYLNAGDEVVYFPVGCQLCPEFGIAAKVFRKHPSTKEALGGYIDETMSVRPVKLRGEVSHGMLISRKSVESINDHKVTLTLDGQHVSSINITSPDGTQFYEGPLGWRYNPFKNSARQKPAKIERKINAKNKTVRKVLGLWYDLVDFLTVFFYGKIIGGRDFDAPMDFHEHNSTPKYTPKDIPRGQEGQAAVVQITEKLHGTSGRTIIKTVRTNMPRFRQMLNSLLTKLIGIAPASLKYCLQPYIYPVYKYIVLSGTRRTICNSNAQLLMRDPSGELLLHEMQHNCRVFAEALICELATYSSQTGATFYYEILGYEGINGKPIMNTHNYKDLVSFNKSFGEQVDSGPIVYSYGTDHTSPTKYCRIYIYRIVKPDGSELTPAEIVSFVKKALAEYSKYGTYGDYLHMLSLMADGINFKTFEYYRNALSTSAATPRIKKLIEGAMNYSTFMASMPVTTIEIPVQSQLGLDPDRAKELTSAQIARHLTIVNDFSFSMYNQSNWDVDQQYEHPVEGCIVNIYLRTSKDGPLKHITTSKWKSDVFCHLEDIKMNQIVELQAQGEEVELNEDEG